jgi:hypothetical protein
LPWTSASAAKRRFDANASDVGRLLDIHTRIGGSRTGRRDAALQALNRAGIVLVCAIWESYCAELLAEALEQLAAPRREADAIHAPRPQRIPVADRGPRMSRSGEIDALFSDGLGLSGLSRAWYWPGMSAAQARCKLDGLIVLRAEIAHHGGVGVRRRHVTGLLNHTQRLALKTDSRVRAFVDRVRAQRP